MGSYLVRAPIPVIDLIAATVDAYSAAITDDFPDLTDDERDVQAILMLLTPGADHDPTKLADHAPVVNLFVHTYPGAGRPPGSRGSRATARSPRTGSATSSARCAGSRSTPSSTSPAMAPVDAYEIPDRHRQAVHLMTPADTFPYGSSLSRPMQVDHTIPHDQGGRVRHRQLRTHDHQPPPDQDPRRTGTSSNPSPGSTCGATPTAATTSSTTPAPDGSRSRTTTCPLVVEIYRELPEARLDWDAAA